MLRRAAILLMIGVLGIVGLGTRFDRDARCKDLALEIVKTWFENSPIVDMQTRVDFDHLGCSENFLEIERQRILRGEVEPWVTVTD